MKKQFTLWTLASLWTLPLAYGSGGTSRTAYAMHKVLLFLMMLIQMDPSISLKLEDQKQLRNQMDNAETKFSFEHPEPERSKMMESMRLHLHPSLSESLYPIDCWPNCPSYSLAPYQAAVKFIRGINLGASYYADDSFPSGHPIKDLNSDRYRMLHAIKEKLPFYLEAIFPDNPKERSQIYCRIVKYLDSFSRLIESSFNENSPCTLEIKEETLKKSEPLFPPNLEHAEIDLETTDGLANTIKALMKQAQTEEDTAVSDYLQNLDSMSIRLLHLNNGLTVPYRLALPIWNSLDYLLEKHPKIYHAADLKARDDKHVFSKEELTELSNLALVSESGEMPEAVRNILLGTDHLSVGNIPNAASDNHRDLR